MKRSAAAFAVILALCIVPASALASGNSTNQQYGGTVQSVQDKNASRSTPATSPTTSPATAQTSPSTVANTTATRTASTGSLPFTGLDVGGLAAGAVVLLGAGLMLRRVSSDRR